MKLTHDGEVASARASVSALTTVRGMKNTPLLSYPHYYNLA